MNNTSESSLTFICNLCGNEAIANVPDITRENPTCGSCGSTVRLRAMIYLLSKKLFGVGIPLVNFPVRKDIVGIGMSDALSYAKILSEKFDYTNTYFHQEPFLDITSSSSPNYKNLDFIISTEVLEHVAPPVEKAFFNLYNLLKPEGCLVFSVPYALNAETTLEHFPNLFDFTIEEIDGNKILKNKTRDGLLETFDNLVFHGGSGETLEMRVFSRNSLLKNFQEAGFEHVHIMEEEITQYGILWPHKWSLPMLVSKQK